MGDQHTHPPTTPAAAAPGDRTRHLADAADKADLALRALAHGEENAAATWTVGVMASLDLAGSRPEDGTGRPADTAHWHLAKLAASATGALNCLDAAPRERPDTRAEREGQASLLADDARLHLRSARAALAEDARRAGAL